ncbi:hypothetical protein TNCV_1384951 [Trichonephila clavipes]|nr:hypothetical protein TNCV_1384951 [Trichonephila clavipes]
MENARYPSPPRHHHGYVGNGHRSHLKAKSGMLGQRVSALQPQSTCAGTSEHCLLREDIFLDNLTLSLVGMLCTDCFIT